MNNDLSPTANTDNGSVISEHGFTAILREGDVEGTSGILGAPRINPTRSGLWIEDGHAAALDALLVAILKDSARHKKDPERLDLIAGSGSHGRDPMPWKSADDRRGPRSALTICS